MSDGASKDNQDATAMSARGRAEFSLYRGDEFPRVAAIIPAYNEAETIAESVRCAKAIPGVDLIIVVDDGSTDDTHRIARDAGAMTVRHTENRGTAATLETGAYIAAMNEIQGEMPRLLLFLTGDAQESAATAGTAVVMAVAAGAADCAIAANPARFEAAKERQRAWRERQSMGPQVATQYGSVDQLARHTLMPQDTSAQAFARAAGHAITAATGWRPADPLSGVRCMTRDAYEAAQPLTAGCGVYPVMTVQILQAGYSILEVPAEVTGRVVARNLLGTWSRFQQYKDLKLAMWRLRARFNQDKTEYRGAGSEQAVGKRYAIAPIVPESGHASAS